MKQGAGHRVQVAGRGVARSGRSSVPWQLLPLPSAWARLALSPRRGGGRRGDRDDRELVSATQGCRPAPRRWCDVNSTHSAALGMVRPSYPEMRMPRSKRRKGPVAIWNCRSLAPLHDQHYDPSRSPSSLLFYRAASPKSPFPKPRAEPGGPRAKTLVLVKDNTRKFGRIPSTFRQATGKVLHPGFFRY